MNTKEYYYDGDRYVVSIDCGQNGFFVLNKSTKSDTWEFVVPGSLKWDYLHQDIYYAHHNLDPCPSNISCMLPILPAIPSFTAMEWKDNFLPLKDMPVEEFSFLKKEINKNNGEMSFWFVLDEDLYETFFGDGKFLYFHGEVYISEQSAIKRMEQEKELSNNREEPYKGHMSIVIKKFRVVVKEGEIVPEDFYPEVYEDYSIEQIIERIEEILRSHEDSIWGTRI